MRITPKQLKEIKEAEKRLSKGGGILRDKYSGVSWIEAKRNRSRVPLDA